MNTTTVEIKLPVAPNPVPDVEKSIAKSPMEIEVPVISRQMYPDEVNAALALYEQCLQIRNFEITNLVGRNNFFMVFQGVLIAGVLQSSGSAPPVVMFLASLCGFGISVCQTMTSSGAKFWQNYWERELEESERNYGIVVMNKSPKVDKRSGFYYLFDGRNKDKDSEDSNEQKISKNTHFFGLIQRFSVSKSPVYAGIIFSVMWLSLLLCTLTLPSKFINEVIASSISGFPVVRNQR